MSTFVLLNRLDGHLPGHILADTARCYATPSRNLIDWLEVRDGKTYVNVEKTKRWARKKGKTIPAKFLELVEVWGFEEGAE